MPSMPWVKLWIEILDDVKLVELDDSQKWRFIQLILLAGECDAAGALVTSESRMTHAQVAWRLRCDKSVIEKDIQKMVEIGLITDNGTITIAKFRERQGPTQAEKRQKWAERQEKRRKKAMNTQDNSNVTSESLVTHEDVTPLEEEGEEDKDSLTRAKKNGNSGRRTQAKVKGDMMDGILAFNGKGDPFDWCPPPYHDLAVIFAQEAGFKPLKREQNYWMQGLTDLYNAGINASMIKRAIAKMRKDGLTIASPASILNNARSLGVVKEEKFAEEH